MDHQKELMPTTEGFFVMAHSARDEYFGGSEQGLKYLRENFHIVEGFVAGKMWDIVTEVTSLQSNEYIG